MIKDWLSLFNWIDVVVLFIIVRGCIVGFRRGAIGELIFSGGIILVGVISIRYYSQIGQFITSYIKIPFKYSIVLSYVLLIGGGFILIWLISKIITVAVNLGRFRVFNKIFGIGLGALRAGIICSILLYLLLMLDIDSLSKWIQQDSYSGSFIANLFPRIYEFVRFIL